MIGERAGFLGTEGDLETELVVGADQGAGEDFAEGDSVRQVFLEAEVECLESELGAALVGGAGC